MALLQSLRIAAALPPLPSLSSKNQSHLPRSGLLPSPTHSLQARNQNTQSKIAINLSRRDAIAILSSTLLANFVPTDSAEAVGIRPKFLNKIPEKVKENAGGILKGKGMPGSDDKGNTLNKIPEKVKEKTGGILKGKGMAGSDNTKKIFNKIPQKIRESAGMLKEKAIPGSDDKGKAFNTIPEQIKEKAGFLKDKVMLSSDNREKFTPADPQTERGYEGTLPKTDPPGSVGVPKVP